jgi:hypothetical protein
MKASEIKVGGRYLSKVSGNNVEVEVTAVVPGYVTLSGRVARDTYRVRRVDNGKYLNKSRAVQALHPMKSPS